MSYLNLGFSQFEGKDSEKTSYKELIKSFFVKFGLFPSLKVWLNQLNLLLLWQIKVIEQIIGIMYCKHCGREIDDDSSFCKFCGKAQDNRVSTSNGLIDFITKKPILSSYILWVIINTVCLCSGNKCGESYNLLYPKFFLEEDYYNNDSNVLDLGNYQITDFIVYAILIPLVIYLGYHYFKKVTSIKYRILWALWFIINILWYKWSDLEIAYAFFPFTDTVKYDTFSYNATHYMYPYFSYHAYDLTELVFYTMIIPIAIWGYKYYKDRKKGTKNNK